ncbi:hypothetical protein TrRE_jg898, partial [Triparma retinervis]
KTGQFPFAVRTADGVNFPLHPNFVNDTPKLKAGFDFLSHSNSPNPGVLEVSSSSSVLRPLFDISRGCHPVFNSLSEALASYSLGDEYGCPTLTREAARGITLLIVQKAKRPDITDVLAALDLPDLYQGMGSGRLRQTKFAAGLEVVHRWGEVTECVDDEGLRGDVLKWAKMAIHIGAKS